MILIQSSTEIQGSARCYINGDVMLKYFITHAALFFSPAVIYYILSIPFYVTTSFLHHFSSWHCYILTEAHRDNIITVAGNEVSILQIMLLINKYTSEGKMVCLREWKANLPLNNLMGGRGHRSNKKTEFVSSQSIFCLHAEWWGNAVLASSQFNLTLSLFS